MPHTSIYDVIPDKPRMRSSDVAKNRHFRIRNPDLALSFSFRVKGFQTFQIVPSLPGSGRRSQKYVKQSLPAVTTLLNLRTAS
jgi:hypothetical protein